MVSEYYIRSITDYSKKELASILIELEFQLCLVGGWAVHYHANEKFRKEFDRDYIGSRDIDLGVHIDPAWDEDEMKESYVWKMMNFIERELGYEKSRFGFVKHFERKTGEPISEEKSKRLPLHDLFSVFIDIIPDTEELDVFKNVFGFVPPSEPLLKLAFIENKCEPLETHVDWDVNASSKICNPDLLASMKVRSIPKRDKEHKRVKDVCDLYALLWYVDDYRKMLENVARIIDRDDLEELKKNIDEDVIENASNLIDVDKDRLKTAIEHLYDQALRVKIINSNVQNKTHTLQ